MSRLNWKTLLVGIAVGALVFASAPVIADIGDPLIQGQTNVTNARTIMKGAAGGANLKIVQQKVDTPGLSIVTPIGAPPMKVNRKARVKNLNADLLDGRQGADFLPAVAKPGDVVRGTFVGIAEPSGENVLMQATFVPALPYPVPFANMHYLSPGAAATADCPGNLEAAPGHVCVYANWENNISFTSFLETRSGVSNATTEYGFVIRMLSTGTTGNVRGTWVHTVPATAPALAPATDDGEAPDEIGG